jgi:hypothetical protein
MPLMRQATIGDCLSFDPFAFEEDGLGSSKVDVSRREIAQALMIAGMVVMSHEGRDLTFEIAGQVIVLKQDAVLERLMPALDLALGLRVIGVLFEHSSHQWKGAGDYAEAPMCGIEQGLIDRGHSGDHRAEHDERLAESGACA